MTETKQSLVVESNIRMTTHIKPEALAFFREHGCDIQTQQSLDIVIFPVGSRQEKLSRTSKRCSNIILPDGTCITAMDCYTRFILLLIDLSLGHTTHLTY